MTWEQAAEELIRLAETLEYQAHLWKKNPFPGPTLKARRADELARRCRRLARKSLTLPHGLAGPNKEAVLLQLYRETKIRVGNFLGH